MAVNLRVYNEHARLKVRLKDQREVQLSIGDNKSEWPHNLAGITNVDNDGLASEKHVPGDDDDVVEVLDVLFTGRSEEHMTSLTRLDGTLSELPDGGFVLFAEGHVILWDADGDVYVSWCGSDQPMPGWYVEGQNPFETLGDYLIEREERRNRPLEINWSSEHRDPLTQRVLANAAVVNGYLWRWHAVGPQRLHLFCGLGDVGVFSSPEDIDEHIRNHYKQLEDADDDESDPEAVTERLG